MIYTNANCWFLYQLNYFLFCITFYHHYFQRLKVSFETFWVLFPELQVKFRQAWYEIMANFEITKMQVEKMYAILQLIVHVNYLTLKMEEEYRWPLKRHVIFLPMKNISTTTSALIFFIVLFHVLHLFLIT